MYQNLQVNPIINDIMCVSYEVLSLNTNTNNRCLETFQQGIPDNATIIYSPSDNGIIVLGYYVLDALNMSHSAYFDFLRDTTIRFEGFDPRPNVENTTCIHINEWLFDESLRNTRRLQHIFLTIISNINDDVNHYFVWCDSSHKETLFYPINKIENRLSNTNAIFYFSRIFMYEY